MELTEAQERSTQKHFAEKQKNKFRIFDPVTQRYEDEE